MNYPQGIVKNNISKKPTNYANRGMNLEILLNTTNKYYLDNDIAIIYKKPTPIKVTESSFKNGIRTIKKAFFEMPSTLDYNGIYKGYYIEFDAKETLNKTSFPLSNIHKHQLDHIRRIINHGGICFLIIKMNGFIYYFSGYDLISFIDNNTRKSIPYSYIKDKGITIEEKYLIPIDYIKVIDNLIKENKNEINKEE